MCQVPGETDSSKMKRLEIKMKFCNSHPFLSNHVGGAVACKVPAVYFQNGVFVYDSIEELSVK